MKVIELKDSGLNKIKKFEFELKEDDLNNLPKGLTPGEWIVAENKKSNKSFVAYVNLHSESPFKVKVVTPFDNLTLLKNENIELIIVESLLKKAFEKRVVFKELEHGYRMVHGAQDNLPGLIIDVFVNAVTVQINTAGIDKFRDNIKDFCEKLFPEKKVYLLDDDSYRKHEFLPQFPTKDFPENVEVIENGFKYKISKDVFQKIGFYYDHRNNRKKLENKIKEMNKVYNNGLDLFSYVGSWGLHALRAGVKKVEFVDQGNMGEAIANHLSTNGFTNRGEFFRSDVFKFLDLKISEKQYYDLIISDPPAFTKSEKNKNNAVLGYEKLHQKCLKILSPEGLFVAASCTHYLSLEELDKTVQVAANREGVKLQMLDLGIQSPDHPISSFLDKGNYIKYILYRRI